MSMLDAACIPVRDTNPVNGSGEPLTAVLPPAGTTLPRVSAVTACLAPQAVTLPLHNLHNVFHMSPRGQYTQTTVIHATYRGLCFLASALSSAFTRLTSINGVGAPVCTELFP